MKKIWICAGLLASALLCVACTGEKQPPIPSEAPVTTVAPETTALPETEAPPETVIVTSIVYVTVPVTETTEAVETTEVTEVPETTEVPDAPFDIAVSDLDEYITLGKYLGIEVPVTEPAPIAESAVEERVTAALRSLPEEAMVLDRAAEEGDTVCIDFVGKIDGEAFEGGSAEGYTITLGSGVFIEGFESGVVGMTAGETRALELTFPENYYTDLAGRAVVFDVTLRYIYPTLTDAVAQTYLGASDAASYRARIADELEATRQTEFAAAKEEAAWTKALANSRITDYPEELLQSAFESAREAYVSLAEMYGMSYEDLFLYGYGISVEEAESILLESSKNIVAQQLLLYAIARDMGLDVSDERFEEDLAATAAILGLESVDALIAQLGRDRQSLKEDKLYSQIISEIIAQANFVVQAAE